MYAQYIVALHIKLQYAYVDMNACLCMCTATLNMCRKPRLEVEVVV